jgi:hypothetical protein
MCTSEALLPPAACDKSLNHSSLSQMSMIWNHKEENLTRDFKQEIQNMRWAKQFRNYTFSECVLCMSFHACVCVCVYMCVYIYCKHKSIRIRIHWKVYRIRIQIYCEVFTPCLSWVLLFLIHDFKEHVVHVVGNLKT